MDNLDKTGNSNKFDTPLYCIRDKKTNKILGVSFSPEGLEYIANKTGRILLFRNARFAVKYSKFNHLNKYQEMKDSGRYDDKTLNYIYNNAKVMNSFEDFWEKSIEMKLNYYNYIFKREVV